MTKTFLATSLSTINTTVSPIIGDELVYMGAPLGVYHPPVVPIFRGIYSGDLDASASMVTFPAAGGSSGGPVFNSQNRIVGVVFAANRGFHHISLVTNHRALMLFLRNSKKKFKEKFQ